MMIHRARFEVKAGQQWLQGSLPRYELLERVARAAEERDVDLLAFGFGAQQVRLVLHGPSEVLRYMVRGTKVGTSRRLSCGWDQQITLGPTDWSRPALACLEDDVVWAHQAPLLTGLPDPLASPWSSHRDLLGFRCAPFYDPVALGDISPHRVHQRLGGRPLPSGWPPGSTGPETLPTLLRVAAAVQGVLPADRRCFRLFVHLGKLRGWKTGPLAEALVLTTRRVRQLAATPEPLLPLALISLGDARLCLVP